MLAPPPPPPQSHSKSNQLIASSNQVWWNSIKLYWSYRINCEVLFFNEAINRWTVGLLCCVAQFLCCVVHMSSLLWSNRWNVRMLYCVARMTSLVWSNRWTVGLLCCVAHMCSLVWSYKQTIQLLCCVAHMSSLIWSNSWTVRAVSHTCPHFYHLLLYHTRPHLYGQTDELFNYYAGLHTCPHLHVYGQTVELFMLYHTHVLTFNHLLCCTHVLTYMVKQLNCLCCITHMSSLLPFVAVPHTSSLEWSNRWTVQLLCWVAHMSSLTCIWSNSWTVCAVSHTCPHFYHLLLYHTCPHLYGQTGELFNCYAVLHTCMVTMKFTRM